MNDDDRLRRLLSDAVSDIEPRDRLAEIRASVRPDPQVVPMSRPRPWLYALAGAVASAAVIGVIAYTTSALSGPDDTATSAPSQGTAPSAHPVSTATATDSEATPSSPSTSTSPVSTGAKAYAVYYVGANAAGQTRALPGVAPRAESADHRPRRHRGRPADAGRARRSRTLPLDPDYRTPWRDLATLEHASYGGTGAGDTLQIAFADTGIADRPTGMSAAEAKAAVQQLVYTAQGAIGKRVPVVFSVGNDGPRHGPDPAGRGHLPADRQRADARARCRWSTSPHPSEGEQVSGKLVVTGVNNAFEGNSVIYLERNGKKYATTPATGGQGGHRLFPWRVTLDLTKVPPGEYTLVAENDDASGQGHADSDTRTVEVR